MHKIYREDIKLYLVINIKQKKLCCGCGACVQICTPKSITLEEDKEGFLYPHVDVSLCVDCGLCEKVCPVINQGRSCEPMAVYAAINPDEEIRLQSSSGGIFTLLAESVIAENGVVFGARFDEHWNVIHDYTETQEGLDIFRGSKYVQSRIGNTYGKILQFLKAGRKVLFTGTPCQVGGLKRYLRKEYDNLLTVDFVCHGVPSPKVWQKYLDEEVAHLCDKNSVSSYPISSFSGRDALVKGISFRNKVLGWKKYSFVLTLSKATAAGEQNTVSASSIFYDNAYMQAFLDNLSLRPSCYNCPAKAGKSGSDITLGDFWGIENIDPPMDDDKGASLVLVNTVKGQELFYTINMTAKAESYAQVFECNSCMEVSVTEPKARAKFFRIFNSSGFVAAYKATMEPSLFQQVVAETKRIIKRILGEKNWKIVASMIHNLNA